MAEIYSIAGGKGGVGKSVVSILMSKAFSMGENKTILVDADLGGSNLHTLLGMNYPRDGLVDFLTGKKGSLDNVLHLTSDKNVKLISGVGEVLGMANLKWAVKQKLIRNLKTINADRVVVDLGAGSSFNVLDIFLYTGRHVLVLVPEPTSLRNLNEFLKFCVSRLLYAKFSKNEKVRQYLERFVFPGKRYAITTLGELLDRLSSSSAKSAIEIRETLKNFRPYIVVNMANDPGEAKKYFKAVQSMAKKYLKIEVEHLCTIARGDDIREAIRLNKSLLGLDAEPFHLPLKKIRNTLDGDGYKVAAVSRY